MLGNNERNFEDDSFGYLRGFLCESRSRLLTVRYHAGNDSQSADRKLSSRDVKKDISPEGVSSTRRHQYRTASLVAERTCPIILSASLLSISISYTEFTPARGASEPCTSSLEIKLP